MRKQEQRKLTCVSMKITLNKVADGKWDVLANGEIIGECVASYKYGGSYKVTLNGDDTEIYRFTQKSVEEKVAEYLTEKGMI